MKFRKNPEIQIAQKAFVIVFVIRSVGLNLGSAGETWAQCSNTFQHPADTSVFYVPLANWRSSERLLPINSDHFQPLQHVPLYTSMQEACLALAMAYKRHAALPTDNLATWVAKSTPRSNPDIDEVPHKMTLLRVMLPPEAILSLPVKGQGLRKGGWTVMSDGPFHHFGGLKLTCDQLQFVTVANAVESFAANVSWCKATFVFEIVSIRPWSSILQRLSTKAAEAFEFHSKRVLL